MGDRTLGPDVAQRPASWVRRCSRHRSRPPPRRRETRLQLRRPSGRGDSGERLDGLREVVAGEVALELIEKSPTRSASGLVSRHGPGEDQTTCPRDDPAVARSASRSVMESAPSSDCLRSSVSGIHRAVWPSASMTARPVSCGADDRRSPASAFSTVPSGANVWTWMAADRRPLGLRDWPGRRPQVCRRRFGEVCWFRLARDAPDGPTVLHVAQSVDAAGVVLGFGGQFFGDVDSGKAVMMCRGRLPTVIWSRSLSPARHPGSHGARRWPRRTGTAHPVKLVVNRTCGGYLGLVPLRPEVPEKAVQGYSRAT